MKQSKKKTPRAVSNAKERIFWAKQICTMHEIKHTAIVKKFSLIHIRAMQNSTVIHCIA